MSDTTQPVPGARISAPIEALFHPERGQEWIILQLLRTINTAKLVKVVGVNANAGFTGTVDVQRLVLDVDTNGLQIDETTTYALPFNRLQGGSSAVILDPVAGDIGLAVFADRASQTAIATRAQALPDNDRTHSEIDGFYFGGFLNATPQQFVQFLAGATGVNITTPGTITLNGAALVVNAPTTFNNTIAGTKSGAGNYSFPNLSVNGKAVEGHVHGGVQSGSSNTAPF